VDDPIATAQERYRLRSQQAVGVRDEAYAKHSACYRRRAAGRISRSSAMKRPFAPWIS
jgi:hypothetical protein